MRQCSLRHRRALFFILFMLTLMLVYLTVLLPPLEASHQFPFSVGTLVNLMGRLQKVLL